MSLEEVVTSLHLLRFVIEINQKEIGLFLRHCIGSDLFLSKTIKVTFMDMSEFSRWPVAHTCTSTPEQCIMDEYEIEREKCHSWSNHGFLKINTTIHNLLQFTTEKGLILVDLWNSLWRIFQETSGSNASGWPLSWHQWDWEGRPTLQKIDHHPLVLSTAKPKDGNIHFTTALLYNILFCCLPVLHALRLATILWCVHCSWCTLRWAMM